MNTPRSQANHCFDFEQDFVGSWRCIPLCVRRKLDLIGLKLKLSHWLELSHGDRQHLVDWPDDSAALAALREHLLQCTRGLSAGEAQPLPPSQGEAWQNPEALPAEISQAAQQRGVALNAGQWAALGELERFTLCKLARPGHDHHNLGAALRELLPG